MSQKKEFRLSEKQMDKMNRMLNAFHHPSYKENLKKAFTNLKGSKKISEMNVIDEVNRLNNGGSDEIN